MARITVICNPCTNVLYTDGENLQDKFKQKQEYAQIIYKGGLAVTEVSITGMFARNF